MERAGTPSSRTPKENWRPQATRQRSLPLQIVFTYERDDHAVYEAIKILLGSRERQDGQGCAPS
jgi:hypothetical protein